MQGWVCVRVFLKNMGMKIDVTERTYLVCDLGTVATRAKVTVETIMPIERRLG